MDKKLMLIIVLVTILTIVLYQENKIKSQSLIPQCFEKEDCRVSIKQNYCNIKYDCIQGRCYNSNVLCKETCDNRIDDDLDKHVDCNDTDCWNSPLCPCGIMDFNECAKNRCYCKPGSSPRWVIEITNYCACI